MFGYAFHCRKLSLLNVKVSLRGGVEWVTCALNVIRSHIGVKVVREREKGKKKKRIVNGNSV